MKINSKFAASLPQTTLLDFGCVAIFFATYSVVNAANIGYQSLVDCCTSKSVIVCGKTEKGSLSSFSNLIFRSQMPQTTNNYSAANNSTRNVTPDCESVTQLAHLAQTNEENKQGISNVDNSDVVGNNLNGNDNDISPLTSRIETSYGVVIGRDVNNSTINIYQYPKELIMTKGGVL
jgi:hypothetical protein